MKFLTLVFTFSSVALAGPFTVSGNGTAARGTFTLPAGGGATPVFNAQHELLALGNNLGVIATQIGPLTTQSKALTTTDPVLSAFTNGSGGLILEAGGNGQPFSNGGQGTYSVNYFFQVFDALNDGNAAVVFGDANNMVYTNTSAAAVSGYVGAVLAMVTNLPAGSLAGAAMDAAISWNGGASQEATIVLVQYGANQTYAFTTGVGATSVVSGCNAAFGPCGSRAWGVSLLNGGQMITIPVGGTLNVTGAITLFASGFGATVGTIPLDRVVASGTTFPSFGMGTVLLPEPGTFGLAAFAVIGIGYGIRRRRKVR